MPVLDNIKRLAAVSAALWIADGSAWAQNPAPAPSAPDSFQRDPVGDLNAAAVQAGEFPGSIRLPGNDQISLAIGGFVKAVAIADSDLEGAGPIFLPAQLGTARNDRDGNFGLDASLSRLFFDARSRYDSGSFRGYLEFDANNRNDGSLDFKYRHLYGAWTNPHGTVTAGHTWSTLMDLKILPNGLTEPTVSGPIFARQAQVRWSQTLSERLTYHVAFEDPSSDDVFTGQPSGLGRVSVPDVVGAVELAGDRGHIRVGAVYRTLEVDTGPDIESTANAWGIAVSGRRVFHDKDRLFFQAGYGEGLGRYLLGIQSTSGSAIDPADNQLVVRKNQGAMVGYEHAWDSKKSSSIVLGHAQSDRLAFQPLSEFKSSSFVLLNLMWKVLPQLSMGVEYQYGQRESFDGSSLDNNRVMFGVQFF